MRCRGIRGATTAGSNTKEEMLFATRELLERMIEANGIDKEEVAFAFFTTTMDLNAEFPAAAARELGWTDIALLCGHEMNTQDGLPRCIRIMVLLNTEKRASEIVHVYLHGAEDLRPDTKSQER